MDIQPIDRNTVTYFLYFEEYNETLQIDKPEGLEKADFELKQNSNGYGRYLTFADDTDITFIPRKSHQFAKLCDLYETKKWQTSVYLILSIAGEEFMRGRLKFEDAETDYEYYFSCKMDVNTQREIIEAKKSTSVDLYSEKSVDNKDISKIQTTDVLTKYKEIYDDSSVYLDKPSFPHTETITESQSIYDNVWVNLFTKSEATSDFVSVGKGFYPLYTPNPSYGDENDYTHFKNGESTTKLIVEIKDIDVTYNLDRDSITNVRKRVVNYDSSGNIIDDTTTDLAVSYDQHFVFNFKEEIDVPPYQVLFYYFGFGRIVQNNPIDGTFTFNKQPRISFFSTSIYDDTTTKCARLIDIGKQCLKSITNDAVTVDAPKFTEPGGNFYDIYATSGLELRQYPDQPFYATWNNFADYIRNSFNCDVQINGNEVFIGHQMDFYTNIECGRILLQPNKDSYKIAPNEKLVKSGFSLKYDKYEDDENSSNTIDSIHVSSEWYLPDSQPLDDASDDHELKYIADQYMIENVRRESFNKDSTKTIPNDKEIYVIDTITENGVLQNRSNQGFTVSNLYSPETSYNLRLSVKRLIIDYFSEHLANVSQFTADQLAWKNTSYLNNKTATTQCTDAAIPTTDIEIVEGNDITPEEIANPFLNGDTVTFDLAQRMKFDEFIDIVKNIINDRGYLTFYTEAGSEIKIYVSALKYSWENEKLYNITGERRHE